MQVQIEWRLPSGGWLADPSLKGERNEIEKAATELYTRSGAKHARVDVMRGKAVHA